MSEISKLSRKSIDQGGRSDREPVLTIDGGERNGLMGQAHKNNEMETDNLAGMMLELKLSEPTEPRFKKAARALQSEGCYRVGSSMFDDSTLEEKLVLETDKYKAFYGDTDILSLFYTLKSNGAVDQLHNDMAHYVEHIIAGNIQVELVYSGGGLVYVKYRSRFIAILVQAKNGRQYYITRQRYFATCMRRSPSIYYVIRTCVRSFYTCCDCTEVYDNVTFGTGFKDTDITPPPRRKLRKTGKTHRRSRNDKDLEPHAFSFTDTFVGATSKVFQAARKADTFLERFESITQNVSNAISYKNNSDFFDALLARMEDVVNMLAALRSTNSLTGAVGVLGLYFRTLGYDKSYIAQLMQLMDVKMARLCVHFGIISEKDYDYYYKDELNPQAGEDEKKNLFEQFIEFSKNMLTNWKDIRHSEFVKKILSLISYLVACNWFPKDWLSEDQKELNVLGLKLVSIKLYDITKSTSNIFEAMMESVIFLIERVYGCIKTGSLTSLFYSDSTIERMDEEYSDILMAEVAIRRQFDLASIITKGARFTSRSDYMQRIDKLLMKYERYATIEAKNIKKSAFMYNTVQSKIIKLKMLKSDLVSEMKSTAARKKPYTIMLHGPSGVAKSFLTQIIAKQVMAAIGIELTPQLICSLSDHDKFDSELEWHHLVVVLDDAANMRPECYKDKSPAARLITISNNAPATAIKAEANKKGAIPMNPEFLIVTTNVKDLLAGHFSNETPSILRRFDAVLDIKIRPEFMGSDGMIDPSHFKDEFIPDVWDISVEKVKIIRGKNRQKDTYEFIPIHKSADIYTTLDYLKTSAKVHNELQKGYVQRVKESFDRKMCEHCNFIGYCNQCDPNFKEKLGKKDLVEEIMQRQKGSLPDLIDTDYHLWKYEDVLNLSYEMCALYDDIADAGTSEEILEDLACLIEKLESFLSDNPPRDDDDIYHASDEDIFFDCIDFEKQSGTAGLNPRAAKRVLEFRRKMGDLATRGKKQLEDLTKSAFTVAVTTKEEKLQVMKQQALKDREQFNLMAKDIDIADYCLFGKHETLIKRVADIYTNPYESEYVIDVDKFKYESDSTWYDTSNHYETISRWALEKQIRFHEYIQSRYLASLKMYEDFPLAKVWKIHHARVVILGISLVGIGVAGWALWKKLSKTGNFMSNMLHEKELFVRHNEEVCKDNLQEGIDPKPLHNAKFKTFPRVPLSYPENIKTSSKQDKLDFVRSCTGNLTWKVKNCKLQSSAYDRCYCTFNRCDVTNDDETDLGYSRRISMYSVGSHYWILPRHFFDTKGTDEYNQTLDVVVRRDDREHWHEQVWDNRIFQLTATMINGRPGLHHFDLKACDIIHFNQFDSDLIMIPIPTLGDQRDGLKMAMPLTSKDIILEKPVIIDVKGEVQIQGKIVSEHISKKEYGMRTVHDEMNNKRPDESGVHEDPAKRHYPPFAQTYMGFTYETIGPRVTQCGDCMSPIFLDDPSFPLIGFHLSGRDTTGAGMSIDVDLIRSMIPKSGEIRNRTETDWFNMTVYYPNPFPARAYGIDMPLTDTILERHSINILDPHKCEIAYLGTHDKGSVKFRTSVQQNPTSEILTSTMKIPCEYIIPNSKSREEYGLQIGKQWQKDIIQISAPTPAFEQDILTKCLRDINSKYKILFDNAPIQLQNDTKPYSLEVAINGADGVEGITRLDHSTSMGWPLNKPKKNFMYELPPDGARNYRLGFNEVVTQEIHRIFDDLKHNRKVHAVFRASLKDEPVKIKSNHEDMKIRVFACCDASFTVLVRKYFCPLVRFFYLNWSTCEIAVGINPYGPDWTTLYNTLIQGDELRKKRIIAGDYKKFDKTMPYWVMKAAFSILIELGKTANYSEEDLRIMQAIAEEICNPIYEYDGIFIKILGSNPSGHALTVIINSIANMIYNRYAWYAMTLLPFDEHVKLLVFGDDDIKSVKPGIEFFTYNSIAAALKNIGVTYTNAFKEAISSVPYDDIDNVTFLKRYFRIDSERSPNVRVAAPLEYASLGKMMHFYHAPRASVNIFLETLSQNFLTFVREVTLHGKSFCNAQCNLLLTYFDAIKDRFGLSDIFIFMKTAERSFDQLYDRFIQEASEYRPKSFNDNFYYISLEQIGRYDKLSLLDLDAHIADLPRDKFVRNPVRNAQNMTISTTALGNTVKRKFIPTQTLNQAQNGHEQKCARSAKTTVDLEPHMDQEVMSFSDKASQVKVVSCDCDPTYEVTDDRELSLDRFLRRPIHLNTTVLEVATDFSGFTTYPWADLFANPRIANKISHYKYFKGDIVIKAVISATPFHYGRYIMYYIPLSKAPDHFYETGDSVTSRNHLMRLTQYPHVFIDPSTNQGGQLTMPMIHPANKYDLLDPEGDMLGDVLGVLHFRQLTPLGTVQPSSQQVRVDFFAWFENVQLSVPTTQNIRGLVAQAEDFTEPISTTLSTVAHIAGAMSDIPIIKPYALATQIASTAAAKFAKEHGYSRPIQLDQPKMVRHTPIGQVAAANAIDPCTKLSLDVNQETTIDPRTMGVNVVGETLITSLAAREANIYTFEWKSSDVSGTQLFQCVVTPKIFTYLNVGEFSPIFTTSSGWLSGLFEYWRGTMKYAFRAYASAFHSGRLRVVFEPKIHSNSGQHYNMNYSWIIDLRESHETIIDCGWISKTNYLPIHRLDGKDVYHRDEIPVGNTTFDSTTLPVNNGEIAVYVLSPLITPTATAGVQIDVGVYASCPDLQLRRPFGGCLSSYIFTTDLEAQSEDLIPHAQEEILDPVTIEKTFSQPVSKHDPADTIFFGESIEDINLLLKRYCLSDGMVTWIPTNAVNQEIKIGRNTVSNFPKYPGYFGVADALLNENSMTYLNWITPAFVGWRGSIRWKYIRGGGASSYSPTIMSITNLPRNINNSATITNSVPFPSSEDPGRISRYTRQYYMRNYIGGAITNSTNPVLEVNIPWASNMRFANARNGQVHAPTDALPKDFNETNRFHEYKVEDVKVWNTLTTSYVAAGDDFTLFFFLCTPVFFKSGLPTAP